MEEDRWSEELINSSLMDLPTPLNTSPSPFIILNLTEEIDSTLNPGQLTSASQTIKIAALPVNPPYSQAPPQISVPPSTLSIVQKLSSGNFHAWKMRLEICLGA